MEKLLWLSGKLYNTRYFERINLVGEGETLAIVLLSDGRKVMVRSDDDFDRLKKFCDTRAVSFKWGV